MLLYFLVTGQTPARLNGLTTAQAAEACTQRKPLIDLRSDLPETFLRSVNRALCINPDERFRSAGEMAEALAASLGASTISQAEPKSAPPPPPPILAPVLSAKEQRREKKEKEKKEKEKKEHSSWVKYAIATIVLLSIFGRKLPIISRLYGPETAKSAHIKAGDIDVSDDSDPGDKPDPTELYEQGQALLLKSFKESNLTAAIDKFNQIPASDPNYPLALAGLGSAHFIQYRNSQDPKLLDQAIAETNKAIKLSPDAAPPYVTLARIAAVGGHNAVAMDMAQKAMSLDHSNADAYRAEAEALYAEGRHPEAIDAMQKAADLAPDDWRFPNNLGLYLMSAGQLAKASDEFKRSIELAPDNAVGYFNLGLVDLKLNKLDEAKDDIQKSLAVEPQASTYEELSWLDIDTGAFSDAITASQKAIALDPSSYVAWHSLGDAYRMVAADHDQSIAAYRNAIRFAEETRKKEPKDAELSASLAVYYARVGDKARAAAMIRQATLLSPEDTRVDYLAGQAAEIIGDRAKAIDLIAKCVGIGYSLAEINRNPDLAALRNDPHFQERLHSVTTRKS